MPKEIETKFKIEPTALFKKTLKKIGAKLISRELEQDTYYHNPALRSSGNTVRLRAVGNKGVFTIKTASANGQSRKYKIRDEHEVGISDVKAFNGMLHLLGFLPRFKKEKIRETYEWRDGKIAVDKVPFIGFYAEIEAPKKTIKEAARLLGLDISNAIPDTYMQLFNYYKILHKKPNLQLLFKDERSVHV